jgi:TRAP-type uncharacterized transport system substrate-binding protein
MRGVMLIGVLTAGLGMAAASIAPAFAQTARTGRGATAVAVGEQESNEWTVGIAGGLLEGTNIRFAAEMAKVLDDRPNLRVLPIVTYGALGNVEDLLYLKGVDVTITSADVLDEFIPNGTISNIKNRIRYICSFYLNEVHVYVCPEIKTLEDLAGKKVSFNTVGSAANLTGGILFDRLHINAEKVFINNSVALEKMRTGEIAGVVHVTGKPTDLSRSSSRSRDSTSCRCRTRRICRITMFRPNLPRRTIPIFFSFAKPWTRSRCPKSWRCIIGLRRPIGIAASPASWNISSSGSTSSNSRRSIPNGTRSI